MRSIIKFRLSFFSISHFPIKRQVTGRLVMDVRVARGQCQLNGQFIIIKFNQFRRIACLLHGIGNNHRNRFTNMAHTVRCQQGTRWFCPVSAITVFHNRTFQIHGNVRSDQISCSNHSGNTITVTCIADIQISDHTMRDRRAENKRMQCIGRCDIVDVFTKSC